MRRYDPRTCITAGELRLAGIPVPTDIPDHAWIHKNAIKPTIDGVGYGREPNSIIARVSMRLTEPFQWLTNEVAFTSLAQRQ